jgi:CRISPR type I-E-associated protein CasB/Cse2
VSTSSTPTETIWRSIASRFVREELPKNRGSRARLRRATTPETLYGIERAHGLVARLGLNDTSDAEQELGYRLASLLAFLPEQPSGLHAGFGQQLGHENVYSKLRFARLLRARKPADRYQQFRRALAQIKYRVDPGELAVIFLRWHTEEVQRAVAYGYFQTSAPAAQSFDDSDDSSAATEVATASSTDQE